MAGVSWCKQIRKCRVVDTYSFQKSAFNNPLSSHAIMPVARSKETPPIQFTIFTISRKTSQNRFEHPYFLGVL